jgi:hypothetical protein
MVSNEHQREFVRMCKQRYPVPKLATLGVLPSSLDE